MGRDKPTVSFSPRTSRRNRKSSAGRPLVKQTIRRVHPGFNEDYYGYRSFAELLQDAEKRGLLDLEYDADRGNYKVRLGMR